MVMFIAVAKYLLKICVKLFTSSKDSKLRSLVNDVNHKFTVKVRK